MEIPRLSKLLDTFHENGLAISQVSNNGRIVWRNGHIPTKTEQALVQTLISAHMEPKDKTFEDLEIEKKLEYLATAAGISKDTVVKPLTTTK